MPAKSRSQVRLLFAKQERGELKPGTAEEFVKGQDVKRLPERVKPKKPKKR